jgi:uncharacterized protein YkwD
MRRIYYINSYDTGKIQFNMLDGINSIRDSAGLGSVKLNAELNAAAATHSRDMAVQSRAWHFGSDGSSPLQRIERVGYTGKMLGENISETFESELETLSAWMVNEPTRGIILAEEIGEIGFGWHQETNGKIWWTLVTGIPNLN